MSDPESGSVRSEIDEPEEEQINTPLEEQNSEQKRDVVQVSEIQLEVKP